jgi:hypothetical protein
MELDMAKAYSSAIKRILKNAGFRESGISKKGSPLSGFRARNASTPNHSRWAPWATPGEWGADIVFTKRRGNAVYVEWAGYRHETEDQEREKLEEIQDVLRNAGYTTKFGRDLIDQLELVVHAR